MNPALRKWAFFKGLAKTRGQACPYRRIEEAAGVLAGRDKLRAKGRTDQAVGRVKRVAEAGVRKARKSARMIVDNAKSVAQDAIGKAKRR